MIVYFSKQFIVFLVKCHKYPQVSEIVMIHFQWKKTFFEKKLKIGSHSILKAIQILFPHKEKLAGVHQGRLQRPGMPLRA